MAAQLTARQFPVWCRTLSVAASANRLKCDAAPDLRPGSGRGAVIGRQEACQNTDRELLLDVGDDVVKTVVVRKCSRCFGHRKKQQNGNWRKISRLHRFYILVCLTTAELMSSLLTRAPLGGGGLFRAPPLVFLRYLLNRCSYHRQTCSTLSPNIFTHCVKILKSRVS